MWASPFHCLFHSCKEDSTTVVLKLHMGYMLNQGREHGIHCIVASWNTSPLCACCCSHLLEGNRRDNRGPELSPSQIHILLHMYTSLQSFSFPSSPPLYSAICWWKVHFVTKVLQGHPQAIFHNVSTWLYQPKCELFLILAAPFLPAAKLFPLHFAFSVVPPSLSAHCQEQ